MAERANKTGFQRLNKVTSRLLAVFILCFAVSCAHAPSGKGADPHTLLENVCFAGREIRSVKGDVWMNLNSKEAKGQFPATVSAEVPDKVTLEVTNLLGAREALIEISGGQYSI